MFNLRLRLLSYLVMAYMLLAFSWWAMLLYSKNKETFQAKTALMEVAMAASGEVKNMAEFEQTSEYQELLKKYKRQERMIFGEGVMFILTLLAGLWFIHKSYFRAVKANQQQRNFLLAITHELKSPIASIQLVLETLLKRELPKPQANRLAASALQENDRLLELVENLLLSARLETAYQPHFEEVDLEKLLSERLAKLAQKHPEARLTFQPNQKIPLIRADESAITSLVINLLENAVKYSEGIPEIEVRLSANEKTATLEIADKGIGIADAEKKRVLEKFYRIGSEETRQTKGTGLGLFIVCQIVKVHKGRLFVLDNKPKGTVFRVELPVM